MLCCCRACLSAMELWSTFGFVYDEYYSDWGLSLSPLFRFSRDFLLFPFQPLIVLGD